MTTGRIIACALGAVLGAGFASGREIMQFFSRHGSLSWALAALASLVTGGLMYRVLRAGTLEKLMPGWKGKILGELLLILLLTALGGSMTAAAGELAALTIPVRHARSGGWLMTLGVCLLLCQHPLSAMERMGRVLIPLLIGAFLLCLRVPAQGAAVPTTVSFFQMIHAAIQAVSYSAMNVMLSAGILCDAAAQCGRAQMRRGAMGAGIGVLALLLLGNGALIAHADALRAASLPTVALLRAYGKIGYYLSASVLYLAVLTTLIAVLRSLQMLLLPYFPRYAAALTGLMAAGMALCGFDNLISTAYPVLGFFCLMLLCLPRHAKSPRPKS